MKIEQALYLDYQATTPLDSRVLAKMTPYLVESFANPHSADHAAGWQATRAVEESAEQLGALIGADPDEIIFTSGATEANNLALLGLARRASGGNRRRILIAATEHKCVLAIARVLASQLGYSVETLPVDRCGRIDLDDLEERMADDVLAVTVMAVNNEIGTIQDVDRINQISASYGTIFHCDGAQAPASMEISSFADKTDLLSLSAHKMYGPKGIGALYIRRDLQDRIEPIIHGGGQQNGLRSGTLPTPLCVGMGAAASLLQGEQGKAERGKLEELRDQFLSGLGTMRWPVRLNGPEPGPHRHPGNANIQFEGFRAHDLLGALQPKLAASTGSACTSGVPEPSHVLRAIGLSARQADASIRFSFGRDTTAQDVTHAIELIDAALTEIAGEELMQTA